MLDEEELKKKTNNKSLLQKILIGICIILVIGCLIGVFILRNKLRDTEVINSPKDVTQVSEEDKIQAVAKAREIYDRMARYVGDSYYNGEYQTYYAYYYQQEKLSAVDIPMAIKLRTVISSLTRDLSQLQVHEKSGEMVASYEIPVSHVELEYRRLYGNVPYQAADIAYGCPNLLSRTENFYIIASQCELNTEEGFQTETLGTVVSSDLETVQITQKVTLKRITDIQEPQIQLYDFVFQKVGDFYVFDSLVRRK